MDDLLAALLDRNARHVASLDADHFDDVQLGQTPQVVSVCCSDSRVSQEAMFAVDEPGWLFAPSNIGNRAWRDVDGDRVVDGNLLYPVSHTGARTVAIVGHTGCGAVTAAYRAATGDCDLADEHPGIAAEIESLVPVVEDALDRFEGDGLSDGEVVDRLVEHNVDRQVAFLRGDAAIPDDARVYGFVYDLHGVYGDRGRTVLVNADGTTDVDGLRALLPTDHAGAAKRLRD